MADIWEEVRLAKTIGIAGHIRPDGDCVGAGLALYNYLLENYNQDGEKTVDLYLECVPEAFLFLENANKVQTKSKEDMQYDLFIALDSSSIDRLGEMQEHFLNAKTTYCVDHHITNTHYAKKETVEPNASSTCEVLSDLFDFEKVSLPVAECLYLGIVHDTGVFKHCNTTEKTMQVAGRLLSLGVNASKIIDGTFYQKTYLQNQILGRCLMESILVLDGKIIISSISRKIQDFYEVKPSDLDGVIDQLRVTKGVEVAIFLREEAVQEYKVSMRSNGIVDVSKIAVFFGGGGHVKAAGCTMRGSLYDVINNLTLGIEHQLTNGESK